MSYLVDADWIVDALHGIPSALQALEDNSQDGLSISIIALGELFDGAYGFPEPEEHIEHFRRFVSGFTVLGLSEPIMLRFARWRSGLRRRGNLIPDFDLLIASTAVEHDLILMTRNMRHFSRIKELHLYGARS